MQRIKARGKWIPGLGPHTPAVEAAEAFLSTRLTAVEDLLPLVHHHADEDPEYVHQLRVATRRADAALRTFEHCLRPKRFRKMRKGLRRIRRAAAVARICDVHAEIFRTDASQFQVLSPQAVEGLLTLNAAEREAAQKAIARIAKRYGRGRLGRSTGKLLRDLRDPAEEGYATLLDSARRNLPDLIKAVHRAAGEDLHIMANLHELRLCGKRLRYAMEIFAPCFEPELKRDFYPLVQQMQEHLGDINDSLEITQRLGRWQAECEDPARPAAPGDCDGHLAEALPALQQHYEKRLEEQKDRFLDFWSKFGVDSLLRGLEGLLTREPVA